MNKILEFSAFTILLRIFLVQVSKLWPPLQNENLAVTNISDKISTTSVVWRIKTYRRQHLREMLIRNSSRDICSVVIDIVAFEIIILHCHDTYLSGRAVWDLLLLLYSFILYIFDEYFDRPDNNVTMKLFIYPPPPLARKDTEQQYARHSLEPMLGATKNSGSPIRSRICKWALWSQFVLQTRGQELSSSSVWKITTYLIYMCVYIYRW